MKATVSMRVETVWANQIEMRIEADLDNPHLPAHREIATSMIDMLQTIALEVRSENERHLIAAGGEERAAVVSNAKDAADVGSAPPDGKEQ